MLDRSQSDQTLRVLRELADGDVLYAEETARATGINRSRVFKILARLEAEGVCTSRLDVSPLHRRRWYRLTTAGFERALVVLDAAGVTHVTGPAGAVPKRHIAQETAGG